MFHRVLGFLLILSPIFGFANEIKRLPSGKPDFSGVYDTGALTLEERPEILGELEAVYPWVANAVFWARNIMFDSMNEASDPNRGAPPKGGAGGNAGGAGNVGGYNTFYIDIGTYTSVVDGMVRTSIIYDPPNGRRPEALPGMEARMGDIYASFIYDNTGTATWLEKEGPGPFDGPETLAPSERCLISFASTVPTLPSLYNNYKRIVQTDDHIMILQEMVHDARVIRIDSEHADPSNRKWLGDSIAYWEGDKLIVETKNFKNISGLGGADENLHVVERFSYDEDGQLIYDFTVTDETVWSAPWSGLYVWQEKNESKVYEYACHEGHYAMGNILRGARLLEKEWREKEALIAEESVEAGSAGL